MPRTGFLIVVFFLLTITLDAPAQIRTDVPRTELDSLIGIIPQLDGKELVDHLNRLADTIPSFITITVSIPRHYIDSSMLYASKAIELARSIDYKPGEARAYYCLGMAYYHQYDLKNSLLSYLMAMQAYKGIYKDEVHKELGQIYVEIGKIFYAGGHFAEAVEYYKKALPIFQDLEMGGWILGIRFQLNKSYIELKSFDSAFYHVRSYVADCRKYNRPKFLAFGHVFIGETYLWMEDNIPEQERSSGSLAIPHLDSALYYADLYQLKWAEIAISTSLGESYHRFMHPTNYVLAEKYYKQAIQKGHALAIEQEGGKENLWPRFVNSYNFLGELYTEQEEYSLAQTYLDSSLMAVDSIIADMDTSSYSMNFAKYLLKREIFWFESNIYWAYHKLHKSLGNHDSAYHFLRLREQVRDSLQQFETRNDLNILLARAENESMQNKLQLVEKQKELEKNRARWAIAIAFGLVLLVIIGGSLVLLVIRQKRLQAQQEKMGLQQKLFRTQMNPHFIFNSLSSIQHLVVSEEAEKASIFLARFSTLVRGVLYSSNKDTIPIEDEIRSVESYLSLQKIRYNNKFEYKIEVDPELDTASLTIPPMLAQPFIENAIEHGIRHKEGKGNIAVRFGINNGSVYLEVEDNGVGREKSHELEKGMQMDHVSMATQITRERLRILNKKVKQKISFNIKDLVDDQGIAAGTRVRIVLPVVTG